MIFQYYPNVLFLRWLNYFSKDHLEWRIQSHGYLQGKKAEVSFPHWAIKFLPFICESTSKRAICPIKYIKSIVWVIFCACKNELSILMYYDRTNLRVFQCCWIWYASHIFCFAPAFRICACTKVTFLFFLLNTKEKGGRRTSSRYPLYIHKSNR